MDYAEASIISRAAGGAKLSEVDQTELQSLLYTVNTQAREIRSLATIILGRVCPQPEEGCSADEPAYKGGYVGQAEQVRTTQREIIEVLMQLAKYA
jgi:hypothetical protein